ncbi:UDP-glucuronate:xylan alpha-glucuronosyltransferase 2 [Dionaea muscipula]
MIIIMAAWGLKLVHCLHKMMMMKAAAFSSKTSLVIRINLLFLALFLIAYAAILLPPSWTNTLPMYAPPPLVSCSLLRQCHHKVENGVKMKAVLGETGDGGGMMLLPNTKETARQQRKPGFMDEIMMGNIARGMKIGVVNMEEGDVMKEWDLHGSETTWIRVHYEKVSALFEWKHLFPEWIDEEQENEGGYQCPEIPMPELGMYGAGSLDMVVAKLPCKYPEAGWAREVHRLQVHLVVANLAVRINGRSRSKVKVVVMSQCRPMMELFRCDNLVKREENWWYYELDVAWLEQKLSLPVGSCSLALPMWGKGVNEVFDVSKFDETKTKLYSSWRRMRWREREAYVSVLHSSETYVCGAITLAQSLIQTGTNRDLILLIDKSISEPARGALVAAGWKIRVIKRIRNPMAEKDSYNEYNYSKFRLWQLTDYGKIIFIDSDIIVLRNLDLLFRFPQMSATGNDGSIFNSGIMVIEPSKCTFKSLMERRREIVSYNGGDQGFLNEVFVWWHRLPRRVNFLKNFWSGSLVEAGFKNQLFGSDPPQVYSIHYLGLKPWLCYRDYDCNWDILDQHVYASDVAHSRWWKLHDSMDKSLQKFCGLTPQRKNDLDWDRKAASKLGINGDHWRINITDPRKDLFIKI